MNNAEPATRAACWKYCAISTGLIVQERCLFNGKHLGVLEKGFVSTLRCVSVPFVGT